MLRLAAGMRDVIFPVHAGTRLISTRYLTLLVILPVLGAVGWAIAAAAFGATYRETGALTTAFAVLAGALILNTVLSLRLRMDHDKARKKAKIQHDLRIPLLLDETTAMSLWGASVGLALMFATAVIAAIVPSGTAVPTPVVAVLFAVAIHFAGCLLHTLTATLTSYTSLVTPVR